jgi:branched-chain amino acid transport system ATP-binding protein
MLDLEDVHIAYGKVEAVKGIFLKVEDREIVSLIGSNGAGKTTTLRAISGLLHPSAGYIRFGGCDITRSSASRAVALGISQVPEGRRIFPLLTVEENLRMGAYRRCAARSFASALRRIFERLPRLEERRRQLAGTLSGGEQQMLSIARALISGPRLIMLDEPSFGLAPMVVTEIAHIIADINRDHGVAVLLVEQNTTMAFVLSTRTYVMENGVIVLAGRTNEVAQNSNVRRAYLGGSEKFVTGF